MRPFVDKWIARSRQAVREFATFGIEAELAPYCVDPKIFFRLPRRMPTCRRCDINWDCLPTAYVIGNFHSDTAFTIGPDRPKWQKGPDVFAEIVRRVRETEPRVCVLLAGPRRHWLRRRLKAFGVPVFFLGRESEGDDFGVNILDRSKLNRLYNLLDLYLVSSRWEGGPHSILEACFAKTKVLSTRVGISEDVLEEASLFDTIPEAVSRISDDIRHRTLDATREPQYRTGARQEYPGETRRCIAPNLQTLSPGAAEKAARSGTRPGCARRPRAHFRRRSEPPTIIGLLGGRSPGVLFDFLRQALRQSGAVVLSESIAGNCRHYLVDESWLSSNDARKPADRKVVMVSDHPASKASRLADAMVVPSFKAVDAARQIGLALPSLVIPPAVDGMSFDPEIPVREQLTSTVAGVAQAIRQLFLVLDAPEDVRWLGFR